MDSAVARSVKACCGVSRSPSGAARFNTSCHTPFVQRLGLTTRSRRREQGLSTVFFSRSGSELKSQRNVLICAANGGGNSPDVVDYLLRRCSQLEAENEQLRAKLGSFENLAIDATSNAEAIQTGGSTAALHGLNPGSFYAGIPDPLAILTSSQTPPPEAQGSGRVGVQQRSTKETEVSVRINLDGTGQANNKTGVGFLDHMLDQLASHGLFDLEVSCKGDLWIDDHHTVEDVAITLGQAFKDAVGDKKGIKRFGHFSAPLDEALIMVTIDLSGRPHLGLHNW
eukprot:CAMPEP_0197848970 /NCGR_PEP_ID=MMETSP1438-20131217/10567_1 /TAXON_ID=1461541 /ORGANISM="Pterosperma sp., Strain CCMP1384" /LENGTH=282 /DNA_ID=CAMNT_0043461455 /DNA_START=16 /DNA_END=861 /DNA_ORIENTATION=+